MSVERFLYYIIGGTLNGKEFSGCKDKTLPTDSRKIVFNHTILFNYYAYISKLRSADTCYGRMYLVKQNQFEDIKAQEKYMYTIDLGVFEGIPVFSITNDVKVGKMYKDYFDLIQKSLFDLYEKDVILPYIQNISKRVMSNENGLYRNITINGLKTTEYSIETISEYVKNINKSTKMGQTHLNQSIQAL